MRLLFFGSLAALACMVMFSAPQIAFSDTDLMVAPLEAMVPMDHGIPAKALYVEVAHAALPAEPTVYAFAKMDRVRTYNDTVRFGTHAGLNPKPDRRYLC